MNRVFRIIVILILTFLGTKVSSAQEGFGIYLGASIFTPMEIETSNPSTNVKPLPWLPSPSLGVEYIHPLKNPDYALSGRFQYTFFYQAFSTPWFKEGNIPSDWMREVQAVHANNLDLNITLEKTVVKGKRSRLNAALGIGVEAMQFRETKNFLYYNLDSLGQASKFKGDKEIHFSPTLNLGLTYRVKAKSGNFWNYGIDYTWAISKKMGTQAYSYGQPTPVEEGEFAFRGSKFSVQVGYTFQSKKSQL